VCFVRVYFGLCLSLSLCVCACVRMQRGSRASARTCAHVTAYSLSQGAVDKLSRMFPEVFTDVCLYVHVRVNVCVYTC